MNRAMLYLGWPVVALWIGVLLAYRNTHAGRRRKARTGEWVENALRTSAMIIMVTGLGGSLSQILRETPAVDAIARGMASTGLPAIFLPFVLGVVGNMITGSTTVGVITAASIAAPMMPTLGLSPEATMLAGAAGSIISEVRELELLLGVHLAVAHAAPFGAGLLRRRHAGERRDVDGDGVRAVARRGDLMLRTPDLVHCGERGWRVGA